MTQDIAVLTGDFVASTSAEPQAVDRAMAALVAASDILSGWIGSDTRFTRFRGDGWQICLMRPNFTLRATLFLIAALRAADTGLETRLSIAIAPYSHLGGAGLAAASGPAFVLSGHQLDEMSRADRFNFVADQKEPASWQKAVWQRAVLALAFHQARSWTREQAEAATFALMPFRPTQEQIAEKLGVTRQAVQARLRGAGIPAIFDALSVFEMETP